MKRREASSHGRNFMDNSSLESSDGDTLTSCPSTSVNPSVLSNAENLRIEHASSVRFVSEICLCQPSRRTVATGIRSGSATRNCPALGSCMWGGKRADIDIEVWYVAPVGIVYVGGAKCTVSNYAPTMMLDIYICRPLRHAQKGSSKNAHIKCCAPRRVLYASAFKRSSIASERSYATSQMSLKDIG
jgi:hypothetical protein